MQISEISEVSDIASYLRACAFFVEINITLSVCSEQDRKSLTSLISLITRQEATS